MTAALRTLDVANRVAHLHVVEETISSPPATGTVNPRRPYPVARHDQRSPPDDARQQTAGADDAKVMHIPAIPRKNHELHHWKVTAVATEWFGQVAAVAAKVADK